MIPQYLKDKGFSAEYKALTVAVLIGGFLPEYIAVAVFFAVAVMFFYRIARNRLNAAIGRTGIFIIGFVAFSFLSVLWSSSALSSALNSAVWVFAFLTFFVTSNAADTKEKIENVILCMIGSATVNSVISVLQMAFMAVGKSKYFPSPIYKSLDEWFYSVINYDYYYEASPDRVSGCFENPLVLATFFVIVFPLAAYNCFYASTKKRRIFSVISCVLIFFGIMFTFLRGAVIAVIASFMILAFTGKKPAKVMSVAALLSAFIWMAVIFERRGVSSSQDLSTNYRIHLWEACLTYIKESPLLGLGSGSGSLREYLLSNGINYANAHSLYIELLCETGIIGFLIFFCGAASGVINIARAYKRGGRGKRLSIALLSSLVGFFVMSLFDYTFQTPKETLYFAVVLGCIEAIGRTQPKHQIKNKTINSRQEKYERKA